MSTPIVFLDTETTSLRHDRRAWEIAMIRREVDGTEAETHLFVDVSIANADQRALAIGGYFDRHPKHAADRKRPPIAERRSSDTSYQRARGGPRSPGSPRSTSVGEQSSIRRRDPELSPRDHGHLPMCITTSSTSDRSSSATAVVSRLACRSRCHRVPDLALCAGIPTPGPRRCTPRSVMPVVRIVYDANVGRGERSGQGRHQ